MKRLLFNNGSLVDLSHVVHAWITDGPQTVHLYFVGGHDAEFTGSMATEIWDSLCEGLRPINVDL